MKRFLLITCAAVGLTACATNYGPPPPGYGPTPGEPRPPWGAPPPPMQFDPAGFAWSRAPGHASIDGQVGYRTAAGPYVCAGAVALMPDAPYSRRRIMRLYGSIDRAAVPISDVRARQATQPPDTLSSFVRVQKCTPDGRFSFNGLPPGGWFVIVSVKPVYGQGEQMVLLRRLQTSPNTPRQVVLR